VKEIALTSDYAVVRTAFGVFVWGSNASQELGPSEQTGANYQPARLPLPQFNGASPRAILALEDAMMIFSENNDLVGFGSDEDFRLALLQVRAFSAPPGPSAPSGPSPSSPPSSSPSDSPVTSSPDSSPDSPMTIAVPPNGVTRREDQEAQADVIDPYPNSISCAATRCYFRNRGDNMWGYFGAAAFDLDYSPLGLDSSIKWIPNSELIVWIESTKRSVVFLKAPSMDLFAGGFDVLANPDIITTPRRLDSLCTPTRADRLRAMGDGFFVYGCFEPGYATVTRVYAFGRNDMGQLGNISTSESYVAAIDEHRLVEIDLAPGERIIALRAGKSTGYAFTTFNNTWAWGWTRDNAMGTYNPVEDFIAKPTPDAFQFPLFYKYQVTDIQSTPAAHGLFLVLAMRYGNCPNLPGSMDMGNSFCDYDNFINFAADCVLTGTSTGEMTSFMKMRGDVYMHGDAQMTSRAGMVMEGGISMYDRSVSLLIGAGELIGDINLFNSSKVQFSGTNVSLVGNLNVGPDASIDLDDMAHTFQDKPSITLNGTGKIQGIVTITYSQEEIDALVQSLLSEESPQEFQPVGSPEAVISPDADGSPEAPSTVSKKSLILETTEGELDVSQATVNIALLQPSSGCASVSASPTVEGGTLSVLFAVTSISGCGNSGPQSPEQALKAANNRKVGIIVGSVIGGVVVLGAVAALLILKVAPIRDAVLPYRGATARRAAPTPLRADA
jgi:hypothetical protein